MRAGRLSIVFKVDVEQMLRMSRGSIQGSPMPPPAIISRKLSSNLRSKRGKNKRPHGAARSNICPWTV